MISDGNINRLGIYAIYDKDGIVDDYIIYFLKDLKENLTDLVIVCNGGINDEGRSKLDRLTDQVYIRPNSGFDCGAYKFALLEVLGREKVCSYDELLLANDTVYGPFYPFKTVFDKMDKLDIDFWGLTEQPESVLLSHIQGGEATPAHIQSYFINVKQRLLRDKSFFEFWQELEPESFSFTDAIINWELGFNRRFSRNGFSSAAYVDYSEFYEGDPKQNLNLTAEDVFGMVIEHRHPVAKRKALARDISRVMKASAGENANAFFEYIDKRTNYDSSLIWQNLLRTSNILAVRDTAHLSYVLSSRMTESPYSGKEKVVAVMFVSDKNFKIEKAKREKELPFFMDTVTLTEETVLNADIWRKLFSDYEYLCFVSDAELRKSAVPRRAALSAVRMAWDNTLQSEAYIINILNTFRDNPRLGLLSTPQAYHSRYFFDFGADASSLIFEIRELADALGLTVPINPTYGRIPKNPAFWCRTAALKQLLALDPEKSHRIGVLGILPYIAQQNGYFSGVVMTENQAATRTVDLEHMLSGILFALNLQEREESFFDFAEKVKIEYMLRPFCDKYEKTYIVSADGEAKRWADILDENGINFSGYVVMDESKKGDLPYGRPVFHLSEINKEECVLILAMNYKNKGVISPVLRRKGFNNVLELG